MVVDSVELIELISSLKQPHENLSKVAVNTLMDALANGGQEAHENILNDNLIEEILKILNDDISSDYLRDIVRLIKMLCGDDIKPEVFAKISPLLSVLVNLLLSTDKQILFDIAWILYHVTNVSPEEEFQMEAAVDAGVIPKLVYVLNMKNEIAILEPALGTLCNICCGKDELITAVIEADGLSVLNRLLRHSDADILHCAVLTVIHIINRSHQQIQAVFDAETFTYIRNILEKGNNGAQENAAWAVVIVIERGTTGQIIHLIQKYKILQPFFELVKTKNHTTFERVQAGIVNLYWMMEKFGRIANLSLASEETDLLRMPYLDNEHVYKKAIKIIETFFKDIFLCNMLLKRSAK